MANILQTFFFLKNRAAQELQCNLQADICKIKPHRHVCVFKEKRGKKGTFSMCTQTQCFLNYFQFTSFFTDVNRIGHDSMQPCHPIRLHIILD